jgi:hypothetical protein
VRVYLPGTVETLRELARHGVVGAAPITAFAVTPGLRDWYVDDDIDELEYAAAGEAARASLRLICAAPGVPPRRVVLSAEAPDSQVEIRDDLDRGVVRLAEAVPIEAIAAVHIDESAAEPIIAAAASGVDAADLGDQAAQDAVDNAEGYELSWYAVQELGLLLADPALGDPEDGPASPP